MQITEPNVIRTVLVFGLLSDSVNKGWVLYWVFGCKHCSVILNAIKSYTIIKHKSNPPLLIQITNSKTSDIIHERHGIELSVSLIATTMNIFPS